MGLSLALSTHFAYQLAVSHSALPLLTLISPLMSEAACIELINQGNIRSRGKRYGGSGAFFLCDGIGAFPRMVRFPCAGGFE